MSKHHKKETIRLPDDVFKALSGLTEHVIAATEPLREMTRVITETVAEWQSGLRQVMEQMAPMLEAMVEGWKTLPERARRALKTIGEHGWYLDIDMPLSWLQDVAYALEKGNVAEAEGALVQYYRVRAEDIESVLIDKFSVRAVPIEQAFKAHRRNEFFLSVPVFLAQSDGICKELTGFQLFGRRDGVPKTATYVKSIEDELTSSLLYPLSIPLPVSASEHERETWPDSLNRHAILHGESLDYGTEPQSLKSISLLNYIATVLTWKDDA